MEIKKRKIKKRYIILSILSLLLVAGLGYGYSVYRSLHSALDTMHEPIKRETEKREKNVSVEKKEPFSVLILGVDERKDDPGRSDTMVVVTVNPNTNSVKMLSIPRDTYVHIVGKDKMDKINHTYAFGGVDMAIDTVEDFLDIPIDYYVKLNFKGFREIVDALGGVTVNNDMDLTHGKYTFPKGTITLNGKEALTYSRIRYEDPRGDFGRQLRQRQVMEAIINKGASISSLWKYQDIFEALGKNVKTNLKFNDIVKIQQGYADARKNIEQLQFKGDNGGFIGKYWYYFADEEEVKDFQHILQDHLELAGHGESNVTQNEKFEKDKHDDTAKEDENI